MHECRKSISAVMAMCFCVAAAASPALAIHEAIAHVDEHHRHAASGSTPAVTADHHPHDDHGHSRLSEASVSMRGAQGTRDATRVALAVTAILLPTRHVDVRVSARPIVRPPRSRDPHSITTVLRI